MKYVQFPMPRAELNLCILGNSDVLREFAGLEERVIEGRGIRIHTVDTILAIKHCDVIFLSRESAFPEGAILTAIGEQSVLIVGETDGFVARGGTIGFYLEGNKVRFEISPTAAKERKLTIGSQLLRLARIVSEREQL
ncbi:MAG: YfiR family protein [Bdellovibrionales bacterium]|nr:YfiR family protein [Bdellovibrionales bacterium]